MRGKARTMRPHNLTSSLPLTIYLGTTHCSWKNSKELVMFGLWNPSERVREKAFSFSINFNILLNGKMSLGGSQNLHRQSHTSFKDISWTRSSLAAKSLISEFTFWLPVISRWQSISTEKVSVDSLTPDTATISKTCPTPLCILRMSQFKKLLITTMTSWVASGIWEVWNST